MPWRAWKEVALRSWSEANDDNIGLIAAGVAFHGSLALVPLLGAAVLSYGLVAEPATVLKNMKSLTSGAAAAMTILRRKDDAGMIDGGGAVAD